MKMPLLSMPSPAPTASTPLALPRPLAAALQTAESLLTSRSRLNELLSEQTKQVPVLLRTKLEAETRLARVRTDELLGTATDGAAQDAEDELSIAQQNYKNTNGIRSSLRERLLDQEPSLAAAQSDIGLHLPEYEQEVVAEFQREYAAASEAFARVLGRGARLAQALKVDIPMPMPMPRPTDAEVAGLGDALRIGQTMDDLAAALNQIVSDKQQSQRESNRYQPFQAGCVWEMVKPYASFSVGQWIEHPLLSEGTLEKLYAGRVIRRVSDAELSQDRDASATVPA